MLDPDTATPDSITLTTEDSPPTSHVVSRSRLRVLSPSFDDILSIPLPLAETSSSIPLTDPLSKVKGLIMVFQGRKDQLARLRPEEWSDLVEMADKYDCEAARREVEFHMWFVAFAESHPN
jgi:hypothetical protein